MPYQIPTAGIEDSAVNASKIATDAVGTTEIISDGVRTADIQNSAVTTDKLNDASVTLAKCETSLTNALVPVGGIIMYFGTESNIPTNWKLCNGQNGTPDLRNRFIVGAGSGYGVGDTGGADTVTLTTNEIPAHGHSGSASGAGAHSHSGTTNGAGAHSHSYSTNGSGLAGRRDPGISASFSGNGIGDVSFDINGVGDHTHTFSTSGVQDHTHVVTVENTGGGQAHENRPPYYALAYIMRAS